MVLPKDELYSGVEAQQYESRRAGTKTWRRENKIVESFLRRAGRGDEATVLDVPVGTGRFLDLYEALGLRVIGFDISGDMLEQARKRQRRDSFLGVADIRMLPLPAGAADVAVCIRLLHLVDGQMRDAAIAELGRVVRTHGYVILGTRMHEWMMPDSPARKRIGDLFRVAQRTLRFRTGGYARLIWLHLGLF